MPTYEYECSSCGGTFEVFQSMKDEPLKDCTLEGGCGATGTLKRLIGSGGGLIFKGSGFYETDYKKNGSGSNGSKSSSSSSSSSSSGGCCGGACKH